jgi:hypothetical protein
VPGPDYQYSDENAKNRSDDKGNKEFVQGGKDVDAPVVIRVGLREKQMGQSA